MNKKFSTVLIVIFAVVLIVLVGMFWRHQSNQPQTQNLPLSQPANQSTTTSQVVTSTTNDSDESNASSSTKGVLFIRNGDIWLANVDGTNQRQLTNDGFIDGYAYAPLSETIAYDSLNVTSTSALIRLQLLDVATGNQKTVYTLKGGASIGPDSYTDYYSYMLSISPNGRYVAFGGEFFTGPSIAVFSQTPTIAAGTLAMIYDTNSNKYISLMPPTFGNDEVFDDQAAVGTTYDWPLSFSPDSSMLLVGGTTLMGPALPESTATATVDLYSLTQNTTTIVNLTAPNFPVGDLYGAGWQWASTGDMLENELVNASNTPTTVDFNTGGVGAIVPTATSTIVNFQECQKLYYGLGDFPGCNFFRNGKLVYANFVPGIYNSTLGTYGSPSDNIVTMNSDGTDMKQIIDNGDDPQWYY